MKMTKRWYEERTGSSGSGTAATVFQRARELRKKHHHVFETARRNYGLYDHRGEDDGGAEAGCGPLSPKREDHIDIDDNVVKSLVDTAVALIAAQGIAPAFATNRGSWSHQREAKNLGHWTEGWMEAENFRRKDRTMFRDSLLGGLGTARIIPDRRLKRPRIRRCLIDEILVDEWDSRTGEVLELLHEYRIDRRQFAAYAEDVGGKAAAKAVMAAPSYRDMSGDPLEETPPDQVRVIEAWRVASYPGAEDGRHGVYIDGVGGPQTLAYRRFARDCVPFAFFRFCEASVGFYGDPLVSDLAGFQMRKTICDARTMSILDRLAKVHIMARENETGSLMKAISGSPDVMLSTYKTMAPTIAPVPALHPDLLTVTDRMEESAQKRAGISEFHAYGKKPADVRSQPGLREVSDIQSQRFMPAHLGREEFTVDVTKRGIEAASELHAEGVNTTVAWNRRSVAAKIKWSDVSNHLDDHVVQIQAASALARSVAGRKDLAADLLGMGMIQPATAMKILDIPDIDEESELELAEMSDADAIIERLEDGEAVNADPRSNQELVYERVRRNYLRIKHQGAPDEILDAHDRFLSQTEELMSQQAQKAMAAMPQQQGPSPDGLAPDVESMIGGGMPPTEPPII